jgi:hypothetical protein
MLANETAATSPAGLASLHRYWHLLAAIPMALLRTGRCVGLASVGYHLESLRG